MNSARKKWRPLLSQAALFEPGSTIRSQTRSPGTALRSYPTRLPRMRLRSGRSTPSAAYCESAIAHPRFFLLEARLSILWAGWTSMGTDCSDALLASVSSAARALPQATGSACSAARASRWPKFSTVRWRERPLPGSHQLSTIERLTLPPLCGVCLRYIALPSVSLSV